MKVRRGALLALLIALACVDPVVAQIEAMTADPDGESGAVLSKSAASPGGGDRDGGPDKDLGLGGRTEDGAGSCSPARPQLVRRQDRSCDRIKLEPLSTTPRASSTPLKAGAHVPRGVAASSAVVARESADAGGISQVTVPRPHAQGPATSPSGAVAASTAFAANGMSPEHDLNLRHWTRFTPRRQPARHIAAGAAINSSAPRRYIRPTHLLPGQVKQHAAGRQAGGSARPLARRAATGSGGRAKTRLAARGQVLMYSSTSGVLVYGQGVERTQSVKRYAPYH